MHKPLIICYFAPVALPIVNNSSPGSTAKSVLCQNNSSSLAPAFNTTDVVVPDASAFNATRIADLDELTGRLTELDELAQRLDDAEH